MAKYRKKPVVIEAVQWKVTNHLEIVTFSKGVARKITPKDDTLIIHTLEGDMVANPNDWIIKGVKDELYPCKPDIFEATYELVRIIIRIAG